MIGQEYIARRPLRIGARKVEPGERFVAGDNRNWKGLEKRGDISPIFAGLGEPGTREMVEAAARARAAEGQLATAPAPAASDSGEADPGAGDAGDDDPGDDEDPRPTFDISGNWPEARAAVKEELGLDRAPKSKAEAVELLEDHGYVVIGLD